MNGRVYDFHCVCALVVGFCCIHMHCGFQTCRRSGLSVLSGMEREKNLLLWRGLELTRLDDKIEIICIYKMEHVNCFWLYWYRARQSFCLTTKLVNSALGVLPLPEDRRN
jgi:hypothetical protein